ncbi:MAG: 23S rRNA (uracil(1939)-C(5))-methyltransferase [Legionellales bacterium RIFCSPHIGHO2_12_FULL_42_9]|nr:MAG: 23S rRNA (uracil(1939)-C(5))-methyltransferase [Legionellales bacterium RIFCSPHIGHO2_12_FULL_42_9]
MRRREQAMLRIPPRVAMIEKFSHDARGIARIDGKTTFIQGALPGETVFFKYTQKKKGFDEGYLLSVISPSPDRVEASCPHYALCGGCSLQHLRADVQIQVKQEQLVDLLQHVGRVEPLSIMPPLVANHWHYRGKARFSVRFIEKNKTVVIGFRERQKPEYITAMTQCPVLDVRTEPLMRALPAFIQTMDEPDKIPQIEVAVGDDGIALIIRHLNVFSETDKDRLRYFAKTLSVRLFLQPTGIQSVHLFYPEEGDELLTYTLLRQQLTFQFHPTDFTQVNAALNQAMVTQALAWLALTPEDIVLDLFCGLGNFSLPMAKLCARVIGAEGSATMVARARMNAQANGLTNTVFECINLDQETGLFALSAKQANVVLLDPPRTGALTLVKQIERINPLRVLYVSCDSATFARDAAVLVHEKGYRLLKVGVMDMFPHTAHVEVMALFQK